MLLMHLFDQNSKIKYIQKYHCNFEYFVF